MSGKSFRILLIAGIFALAFAACQKKAQPEGVPSNTEAESPLSETAETDGSTEAPETCTDPPETTASSTQAPTESTPLFETPSAPPIQTIYVPPYEETTARKTSAPASRETTLTRQTDPPEEGGTTAGSEPPTTKARGHYTGGNPVSAPPSVPSLDLRTDPTAGGYPAHFAYNGNKPLFSSSDIITCEELLREYSDDSFEFYSPLDGLGRCGYAFAIAGPETMPTEPRASIAEIRPSGWHTVRYDDLIYDKYLYNRCHLISYSLTGENANARNLITGTRYMNTLGMIDYENEAVYYIRRTGNHVLYRSTPVLQGSDLVATGVLLEAYSLEDRGAGLSYCIFCPNVQPGIIIDYATGNSRRAEP